MGTNERGMNPAPEPDADPEPPINQEEGKTRWEGTPPDAPSRKTVYVCSPLAGEIEENIRKAREYSRFVARQGATPIAPHITELFDDAVPEERELGLEMGLDYLRKADELWVFGNRISAGMAAEIKLAQTELNIPIYHVGAPPFEPEPLQLNEKGEFEMTQSTKTLEASEVPEIVVLPDAEPARLEVVVSPDMELERMEPEETEPDEALPEGQDPDAAASPSPRERFCARIEYQGADKKTWKTEYYFDRAMYESKLRENDAAKTSYRTRLLKRPELFQTQNIGCVSIQGDSRVKGNQCIITTREGKEVTIHGEDHGVDFRQMPPLAILKFFDAHPQLMNPPEGKPENPPKEVVAEATAEVVGEPIRTEPAPQPPAARSTDAAPERTREPSRTAAPLPATNFTRDQLRRAKEVDLLNYLQTHGYTVKPHGAAYKVQLDGHDSDTVFPDTNTWYSFRTGEGRDIVDWLVKRENKTMVGAVQELTGETFDPQKPFRNSRSAAAAAKTLELPQTSERQSRMFAYLLKTRRLDAALVKKCVADGLLYQGVTVARKEEKEYRFENCCFVGKDETGAPKSVMLRSMNSEGRIFKGNARGSDREYGWTLPGKPDAKRLTVCESPIEALSIATLHKQHGEAWDNEHYLSLNGITESDKDGALMQRAMQRVLDTHPQIDTINIALNNDQDAEVNHGKTVGEQIKRLFFEHYKIVESYPRHKDYNDELRYELAARERARVELPPKAASNNHALQYLTQTKRLDVTLVQEWIADGRLYQSDKPVTVGGKERTDSQTVFVNRDENGIPTYAMGVYCNYRADKADFKRDYRGEESTGNYLEQSGSNHTLMVFNNPISMLAHQSYLREQNVQSKNNYLCCLRDPAGAVQEYVAKRTDITQIKVMLDETRSFNKENQMVDYRELSFQKIKKTFSASQISVERKYPKGIDLSRDLNTLKQGKMHAQIQAAPIHKRENGREMER